MVIDLYTSGAIVKCIGDTIDFYEEDGFSIAHNLFTKGKLYTVREAYFARDVGMRGARGYDRSPEEFLLRLTDNSGGRRWVRSNAFALVDSTTLNLPDWF